jgi:DNA-binding MarR family transcriptional regulator
VTDKPHDIRAHVVFRMSLFANMTDRSGRHSFAETFGLSLREYRILAVIAYLQPVSLSDLVAEICLDAGQVSRNVAKLVEDGLLTREGGAQRGGKLVLSKEGQDLYRAALARGDDLNEQMMEGLSAEERAVLSKALDQLVAKAREIISQTQQGTS